MASADPSHMVRYLHLVAALGDHVDQGGVKPGLCSLPGASTSHRATGNEP